MIYGINGQKRLTYAACGRCGRIYGVADHRECPDCHGRHYPRIEGCNPGFDIDEASLLQAPVKRF
jgi:N-acetylmuramic acid 6-phosphate (MurNAc-6-P) etherase